MSIDNICFHGEIRILCRFLLLSGAMFERNDFRKTILV